MKDLRRVVVGCVIVSFGVSALLGIVALLVGGDFGRTQSNVLLSTVIVGLESLAVLCYLTLAGHRTAWVGALGGVVSVVCAGNALWLVWGTWEFGNEPWQPFATTLVLALSLAQASLLLRLADRDGFRVGLGLTLALAAVVAAMLIGPIVTDGFPDSDTYWRAFGVVAILDVLGTVVLMAMAAVGARTSVTRGRSAASVALSEDVRTRVAEIARLRGTTPDAVVTEALDALAGPGAPLQQ